jgi:hypothetical protein
MYATNAIQHIQESLHAAILQYCINASLALPGGAMARAS